MAEQYSFSEMFAVSNRPEEPDGEQPVWVSPVWFGPRDGELPACIEYRAILARSDNAVVALSHAFVYSTGVEFELLAQARGLSPRDAHGLHHEQRFQFEDGEPSPSFLRFGLELPGGERVSNLDPWRRQTDPENPPAGPVLRPHGGSGGGTSGGGHAFMRPGYWLWPLPDPGTICVTCEWPSVSIPTTTVEVDGTSLRAAARLAGRESKFSSAPDRDAWLRRQRFEGVALAIVLDECCGPRRTQQGE